MTKRHAFLRTELLLKFFQKHFPNERWYLRTKLGATTWAYLPHTKNNKVRGLLWNSSNIAEGLVLTSDRVYLIGLSLVSDKRCVEHLTKLENAFRKTARFRDYWTLPITKLFLVREIRPTLETACSLSQVQLVYS